jgi:hypothetical protein
LHSLETFSACLALTPLSQAIQTVEWIIPAVQTLHILCVAAVMSSMLMINLRLLGASARQQRFSAVAARFRPFIWWPLPLWIGILFAGRWIAYIQAA